MRDEVLEDIELARAVKRAGGRIALADGSRLADLPDVRRRGAELVDGYSKSLWASFGSPAGAAAVVLLLLAAVRRPAGAASRSLPPARWSPAVALAAYLLGVAGPGRSRARATGGRAWPDALAHPVSVLLFGWLVAAVVPAAPAAAG